MLTDEGGGPALDGATADGGVIEHGEDDGSGPGFEPGELVDGVDPIARAADEGHIHDDDIGVKAGDKFDGATGIGRFGNHVEVVFEKDAHLQACADLGIVVDKEERNHVTL